MKKIQFLKYALVLALSNTLLLSTMPVHAQGIIPDNSLLSEGQLIGLIKDNLSSQLWNNLNTGPDGNLLGNHNAVSFQIYDKSEEVNLSYNLSTSVIPASETDGYHKMWSYNLSASAPSNKDNDAAPLPTLDSLQNAFTIGFSASYSLIPSRSEAFKAFSQNSEAWAKERVRLAQIILDPDAVTTTECRNLFSQQFASMSNLFDFGIALNDSPQPSWSSIPQLQNMNYMDAFNFVRLQLTNNGSRSIRQQDVLDEMNRFLANPEGAVSTDTNLANVCAPEFYEEYLLRASQASWTDDRWSHTFVIKSEVGNEEFDYLDPMTFDNQEVIKQIESITATYTLHKAGNFGAQNWTASYAYQKGFSAPAESTMCLNGGAAPEEDCKSAIFGSPIEKKRSIFSLEGTGRWEQVFANSPVAIKLKASYDFENNVTGIDMPIYLFSVAGEALDSGIRVGWQDETDDVHVGYFYQQKF